MRQRSQLICGAPSRAIDMRNMDDRCANGMEKPFVVESLLAHLRDDALQKWADRCAFGLKRRKLDDAYTTAEVQVRQFGEALKEAL